MGAALTQTPHVRGYVAPTHAVQLGQVEAALQAEPDNAELVSLRDELTNLIQLTKSLAAADAPPAASAAPAEAAPAFRTGDEVMARHEADGKWYPARIASVTNAGEYAVYSVIYTKTRTTETLRGADLRVRKADPNAPAARPVKTAAKAQAQRMMTNDERARERERKKARKEKKLAREAEKNKVHADKQAAWQQFAAKGVRGLNKGYPGAGSSRTSK